MSLIEKALLKKGFHKAAQITKQASPTFYFISHFLPQKKRLASYSIYALCRLSDEAVDSVHIQKQEQLEMVQEKIKLAYNDQPLNEPLMLAFRQTIATYKIPQKYFDELLDGMAMDLVKNRYDTFDDLYPYCYKAASVVGLIQLKIFGHQNLLAEKYAIDLGIALQLSNILRDVSEDLDRNRIYLPQDELKQFAITEKNIHDKNCNENWKQLILFQIKRTRSYYRQGSMGLSLITDQRCRFVAFLILNFYAKILDKIEKNHFDVFKERASMTLWEKILFLVPLTIHYFKNSLIFNR